eukprot:2933906-Alexandrium_andersonii.AAC.1
MSRVCEVRPQEPLDGPSIGGQAKAEQTTWHMWGHGFFAGADEPHDGPHAEGQACAREVQN